MIICHCKGVTDRDIRQAVLEGALTRTDVTRLCRAGSECGGCRPMIDQIVGKEAQPRRSDPKRSDR